jgi:hypothetical protein
MIIKKKNKIDYPILKNIKIIFGIKKYIFIVYIQYLNIYNGKI